LHLKSEVLAIADCSPAFIWYNGKHYGQENQRIHADSTVVSGMFDYHMPERVEQAKQFWEAMQPLTNF